MDMNLEVRFYHPKGKDCDAAGRYDAMDFLPSPEFLTSRNKGYLLRCKVVILAGIIADTEPIRWPNPVNNAFISCARYDTVQYLVVEAADLQRATGQYARCLHQIETSVLNAAAQRVDDLRGQLSSRPRTHPAGSNVLVFDLGRARKRRRGFLPPGSA